MPVRSVLGALPCFQELLSRCGIGVAAASAVELLLWLVAVGGRPCCPLSTKRAPIQVRVGFPLCLPLCPY